MSDQSISDAQDELGSNLESAVKAVSKPAHKSVKGMPERVWIQLENNDDIPPTGLFLSHNGLSYLLQTGEPVAVPEFLLEILDNAVLSAPVMDPKTRRVVGHRDRARFPYRRVAAPATAE